MTDTNRLEALAGMTQETDEATPSAEQQQAEKAEAEAVSQADIAAKQWGMLMFTIGGLACMVAPELRPVYAEERCFAWGQQANAVAEKYGWNGPSTMPELALIAATAGFAVPTFIVVRQKMEMAKDAKDGGLLTKLGLWWQQRKARRAGQTVKAEDIAGGANGSQQ